MPIIIPAKYDVEISVKYDSVSGQTELKMKGTTQINAIVVAGVLSSHVSELLKRAITAAKSPVTTATEKKASVTPEGGTNGA